MADITFYIIRLPFDLITTAGILLERFILVAPANKLNFDCFFFHNSHPIFFFTFAIAHRKLKLLIKFLAKSQHIQQRIWEKTSYYDINWQLAHTSIT